MAETPAVRGEVVSLTSAEKERLKELEGTIRRGRATFVKVGAALLEIREKQLYRLTHRTFDAYVKERWGFSRTHAIDLIGMKEVTEIAQREGFAPPENPSQARAMVRLKNEPEKLKAVVQHAEKTGGVVNTKTIRAARTQLGHRPPTRASYADVTVMTTEGAILAIYKLHEQSAKRLAEGARLSGQEGLLKERLNQLTLWIAEVRGQLNAQDPNLRQKLTDAARTSPNPAVQSGKVVPTGTKPLRKPRKTVVPPEPEKSKHAFEKLEASVKEATPAAAEKPDEEKPAS